MASPASSERTWTRVYRTSIAGVQCLLGVIAFWTGCICEQNFDNFAYGLCVAGISGLSPILTAIFWIRSFDGKVDTSVLGWVFFTILSCVIFTCRVCAACGESMILSCILEFLCTTVQLTLIDFRSLEGCLP